MSQLRINNENILNKPRLMHELAAFYGVDVKTFKSWLMCPQLVHILKDKQGYYFSIAQMKEIFAHLDYP